MTNKKEKPKTEIELDSFLVDVCKDANLQPFHNIFHFQGENPAQKKLGEIFGLIQSNEHSEESAYLPNLLSQVIKREFFLKPNRGTAESFEATLNKVNLALADLAEHEVTSWIDNLDVVIGIMKGSEIHFTKLGNGHIFLSKNKSIMEISKELNKYENNHPVKTFLDISSGELSLKDKVIFSTDSLFESLSLEEITRHTKTFTSNEFDNILKSTLDIEGQNVGTIVINIKEKSVMPVSSKKQTSKLNFFGESKDLSTRTSLGKRCHSLKKLDGNKNEDKNQKNTTSTEKLISSLIPKKTSNGEINLAEKKVFTKESSLNENSTAQKTKKRKIIKKNMDIGSSPISPFEQQPELFIKESDEGGGIELTEIDNSTEKSFNSIFNKAKKTLEDLKRSSFSSDKISLISKLKIKKANDNIKDMSFNNSVSYPSKPSKETKKKEHLETEKSKIKEEKDLMRSKNRKIREKEEEIFEKKYQDRVSSFESTLRKISKKIQPFDFKGTFEKIRSFLEKMFKKISSFITLIFEKLQSSDKKGSTEMDKSTYEYSETKEKLSFKDRISSAQKYLKKSTAPVLTSIKERDWEIGKKRLFRLLKKHKKILLISALVLFFILIVIFLLTLRKEPVAAIIKPEITKVEPSNLQLANKVDSTEIANLESKVISLTGDKDEIFAYTNNGKFFRLNVTNNKLEEIALKNSVRNIKTLVSMPTLRLIFLISEKNVFSYSPVMNRLTDVNIKIPNNISIGGAGVYLQYLYVLDKNSRNIYQFPRKPGGFYNPKARIANQEFFSSAADLAVDDSLLVASEKGEIQQYFEGKLKTSLKLKASDTNKLKIVDIETNTKPNTIYALDSQNGVLFKISKNNPEKQKMFFNKNFIEAQNFWVNEKQDRAFVSTKEGKVLRISVN